MDRQDAPAPASDSEEWLGVDDLMQAPQPAPKRPRVHNSVLAAAAAAASAERGSRTPEPERTAPSAATRIAGRKKHAGQARSPAPLSLRKPAPEAPDAPPAAREVTIVHRRKKPLPLHPCPEEAGAGPGLRDPRKGPGPRIEVGVFWSMLPVPEKHLQLIRDLQHEYRDEETRRGLAEMLAENDIPLKYYKWFVANYARDHRTSKEIALGDGSTAILDVHDAYRSAQWAVRKRHWDFFGKRIKVAFDVDGASHIVSLSQLNAFLFAKRFGLRDLILDAFDELERHFEQGKAESEAAAIRAAKQAAREAGLPEDAPLKRKRGRRRKEPGLPEPIQPIMLSEGTVVTRLSLQD
jgi:hypothetical protein